MNEMIGVLGLTQNLKAYVGDIEGFRIAPPYVLSGSNLSETELFDSFISQPGRYIYEMIRRYRGLKDTLNRVIVFNPLVLTNAQTFQEVLAKSKSDGFKNGVFVSHGGIPIAYSFNLCEQEAYRHLVLLSTWDGEVDAQLLSKLYGSEFKCINLDLLEDPRLFEQNGFELGNYRLPMVWCARSALATLENMLANIEIEPDQFRILRDSIPTVLVCTHHAGDVLFLALAASTVDNVLFQKIITSVDYLPITMRVSSNIEFEGLAIPIPARSTGYTKPDWDHFLEISTSFPKNQFYVYGRGARDYNITDFHLIDHFRFALGASLSASSQLYFEINPLVAPRKPLIKSPKKPIKIVLHMGAGWPLKIFPEIGQRSLVGELEYRGYEVMVLDSPYRFSSIKQSKFEGLERLEKLLADADVVVGMDSFPAHYAAHILKIPTIYLFSSTHPIHSDAAQKIEPNVYPSLQESMSCNPCRGLTKCSYFGGNTCANFSAPLSVLGVIESLLNSIPVFSSPLPPMPSSQYCRELPDAYLPSLPLRSIDISMVRIKFYKLFIRSEALFKQKLERILSIWSRLRGVFAESGLLGGTIRIGNAAKRRLKKY